MDRYTVKFKYADSLSNYEWRTQQCSVCVDSPYEARQKCIKLYGLGTDCEYEITDVIKED